MIAKKPKKLVFALLVTLLVISLAVGCSFTGGREKESAESQQDVEERTAAEETGSETTTEPSEDIADNGKLAPIDTVTHGIHVVDYIVDRNYRIPQLAPEAFVYESVNRDIRNLFDDDSQYMSAEYSVTRTKQTDAVTGEEIQVLSLLITAIDTDSDTVYAAYNVNAQTGEAVNLPDISQKIKSELLAYELLMAYERIEDFSYTERDHEIVLENLRYSEDKEKIHSRIVHWIDEKGKLMCSFPYFPLGHYLYEDTLPFRYTGSYEGFIGAQLFAEPDVVELMSEPGEEKGVPFLLMTGSEAVRINGEILRNYALGVENVAYSFSVHNEILSLAITAEDLQTGDAVNSAYGFLWLPLYETRPYILEQANMTEEEYELLGSRIFKDYFSRRFPEPEFGSELYQELMNKCGSLENVAESVPYFAEDGALWALVKIYQMAGSSYTWVHVPISNYPFDRETMPEPFSMPSDPAE